MEDKKHFFCKNMLVILTCGRQASCKAVVLGNMADNRVLVAGFARRKGNRKFSKAAKMFIKRMNPMHLFPTGYVTDVNCEICDVEKLFTDVKHKRNTLKMIEDTILAQQDDRHLQWMNQKLKLN